METTTKPIKPVEPHSISTNTHRLQAKDQSVHDVSKEDYVFPYRKPSQNQIEKSEECLFLREVGLHLHNGPYYNKVTRKFEVLATFYEDKDVYLIPFTEVLDTQNLQIHDTVLENYHKWDGRFISFWKKHSHYIEPVKLINSIIFNDNKYIFVNWAPPQDQLFSWRGMESTVAVFGGIEIDMHRPVNRRWKLQFKDKDTTLYINNGESFTVVSPSGVDSKIDVYFNIVDHMKARKALEVLDNKFRLISLRQLKVNNKGNKWKCSGQLLDYVWSDGLRPSLEQAQIEIYKNGQYRTWTMNSNEARVVFKTEMMRKKYVNKGQLVFVSNIECSFNVSLNRLVMTGMILLQKKNGAISGADSLNKDVGR